jgi:hypothetical protein
MNILRTLWLAAGLALAGSLHAQACSGGSGGGTDATGNQCSDSATVALYAARHDAAASLPLARTGKIAPAKAALVSTAPIAKMSGAANTPKLAAPGPHRFTNAATPIANPVHTTKVDGGHTSPCSGGSYGGMDMTGNQCGDYPVADTNAPPVHLSSR